MGQIVSNCRCHQCAAILPIIGRNRRYAQILRCSAAFFGKNKPRARVRTLDAMAAPANPCHAMPCPFAGGSGSHCSHFPSLRLFHPSLRKMSQVVRASLPGLDRYQAMGDTNRRASCLTVQTYARTRLTGRWEMGVHAHFSCKPCQSMSSSLMLLRLVLTCD